MSALKAPIDYKNLEEELHAALATDELYKLQNDAKIRAIEQAVPTYEHFRQMVIIILVKCCRLIKKSWLIIHVAFNLYLKLLKNFYMI